MKVAGLSAAAIAVASFGIALAADSPVRPRAQAELAQDATSAPDDASLRPAVVQVGARGFIDSFRELDEENRWNVSHGWSNGDWTANDWRRDQVRLTPEGLSLTLAPAPGGADKPFSSGEISTSDEYRNGYFEARLRMPRGEGLVVGVFTFTRTNGADTWNEIDMEILGRNTRRIELTYHQGGRARNRNIDLPFDAAAGFHTYAFEWRRDVVRWYVDNRLVHRARGQGVTRMTLPQRFIINLWNSQTLNQWVGEVDHAGAPWTLTVSCVAHAAAYNGRSLCAER